MVVKIKVVILYIHVAACAQVQSEGYRGDVGGGRQHPGCRRQDHARQDERGAALNAGCIGLKYFWLVYHIFSLVYGYAYYPDFSKANLALVAAGTWT